MKILKLAVIAALASALLASCAAPKGVSMRIVNQQADIKLKMGPGNNTVVVDEGPNCTGGGKGCVKVTETRPGVGVVGSVIRDIQVSVVNCSNTPPVVNVSGSPLILPDGTADGTIICRNFTATDIDGDVLSVSLATGYPLASLNITSSSPGSVSGEVCFVYQSAYQGNTFNVAITHHTDCHSLEFLLPYEMHTMIIKASIIMRLKISITLNSIEIAWKFLNVESCLFSKVPENTVCVPRQSATNCLRIMLPK